MTSTPDDNDNDKPKKKKRNTKKKVLPTPETTVIAKEITEKKFNIKNCKPCKARLTALQKATETRYKHCKTHTDDYNFYVDLQYQDDVLISFNVAIEWLKTNNVHKMIDGINKLAFDFKMFPKI